MRENEGIERTFFFDAGAFALGLGAAVDFVDLAFDALVAAVLAAAYRT